ncbi:VAN3-binding protein [Hordeum vulgare]|nr:VAN3-binding protein [Hordeum vulgare]
MRVTMRVVMRLEVSCWHGAGSQRPDGDRARRADAIGGADGPAVDAWCSSAIQVLQTGPKEEDRSLALVEHPVMGLDDDRRDLSQLQSWIWLQKAIHPELDYDNKKKWLPRKMAAPWSGISLKKWVKERKQKRKEEARLHRAEVHAAVSVAGVAAVLAAIRRRELRAGGARLGVGVDEGDGGGVGRRARGGAVREGGRGRGRHAGPGRRGSQRRGGRHGRQQRDHAHRRCRHL